MAILGTARGNAEYNRQKDYLPLWQGSPVPWCYVSGDHLRAHSVKRVARTLDWQNFRRD